MGERWYAVDAGGRLVGNAGWVDERVLELEYRLDDTFRHRQALRNSRDVSMRRVLVSMRLAYANRFHWRSSPAVTTDKSPAAMSTLMTHFSCPRISLRQAKLRVDHTRRLGDVT